MKIELGGGTRGIGEGFQNVDTGEGADIVHDLNEPPWPFSDNSVDEVYSSHCLEHLDDPLSALLEIGRICRVGSLVVLRLPDPLSEGAMVYGHNHTIGEVVLRNMLEHFPSDKWWDIGKILKLNHVEPRADPTWFHRARDSRLFIEWSDEEILAFIPRTCHENEFTFEVIEWQR